jgi:hypothetical protein
LSSCHALYSAAIAPASVPQGWVTAWYISCAMLVVRGNGDR